jgi:hypothetical protein
MGLGDEDILRLNELINSLIDDTITEEMAAELQQRLASSEDARRHYAAWMTLSAGLHHEAGVMLSGPLSAHPARSDEQTKPLAADTRTSRTTNYGLVAAIVALATCLLIVVYIWRPWKDSAENVADKRPARNPDSPELVEAQPFAQVKQLSNAQWKDKADAVKVGQYLEQEWLRLSSGSVQIEFDSGVLLSAQGPAEVRVDSDMECFIRTGTLVALAPTGVPGFRVRSSGSEVVDLGTEFGVVATESGDMQVHVFDGAVEVSITAEETRKKKVTAAEAVAVEPKKQQIESVPFEAEAFGTLRSELSWPKRPLRIQFDCGAGAGVYDGTESPAHAAGDLFPHEKTWNLVIGDHKGSFVAADGTTIPYELEIDFGRQMHPRHPVDWDEKEQPRSNSRFPSCGVFKSPLGQDDISSDGIVGLRLRGFPAGRYRVYFIGREARNSYLTMFAFRDAIGIDIDQIPEQPLLVSQLDDSEATKWVDGQTHVVDVWYQRIDVRKHLPLVRSQQRHQSFSIVVGGLGGWSSHVPIISVGRMLLHQLNSRGSGF